MTSNRTEWLSRLCPGMSPSGTPVHSLTDRRRLFEDHIHGLEFEHEPIDRKIAWLLTSQSLLFAALGLPLAVPLSKS